MNHARDTLAADVAGALGVSVDAPPRVVLGMGDRPLTPQDIDNACRARLRQLVAAGMTQEAALAVLSPARSRLLRALGVEDSAVVLTPLDRDLRDALASGRGWDRQTRRRIVAAAHLHGLPMDRLPRVLKGLAGWMSVQRGVSGVAVPRMAPARAVAHRSWLHPILVALVVLVLIVAAMVLAPGETPQDVAQSPPTQVPEPLESTSTLVVEPDHSVAVATVPTGTSSEVAAARDRVSRPRRINRVLTLTLHGGDDEQIIIDLASLAVDIAAAWPVLDDRRRQEVLNALDRMLHAMADRPTLLDATLQSTQQQLGDLPDRHRVWVTWAGELAGRTIDPVLADAIHAQWPTRGVEGFPMPRVPSGETPLMVPVDPSPLEVESWRSRWRHLSQLPPTDDAATKLERVLSWRLLAEAAATMVVAGQDASVPIGRLLLIEDRSGSSGATSPRPREDGRLAPMMRDMRVLMRDRIRAVRLVGRDRTALGPRDAAALAQAAVGTSLEMRREAQQVILSTREHDPLVVRSVLDALGRAQRTSDVMAFVEQLAGPVGEPWNMSARQALLRRVLVLEAQAHQGNSDALQAAESARAEAVLVTGEHSDATWEALAGAWGASVRSGADEPGVVSPARAVAAMEVAVYGLGRWCVAHGLDQASVHRVTSDMAAALRRAPDAFSQLIETQRAMAGIWALWFDQRNGGGP